MNAVRSNPRPCEGNPVPVKWSGRLPAPVIRDAGELWDVLADPVCACTGPAYYMYRDVAKSSEDRRWLCDHEIRFDITVIPPKDLCGEYMKTKGHYHPENPSGAGYPEIYEVLEGNAHFLLQTEDVRDVVMILAKTGDIVIIPPGYGHVTINPSRTEVLQMANLVSSAFQSRYQAYEELHGAAFYEMSMGIFAKNPFYSPGARLRFIRTGQIPAVKGSALDPLYQLVEQRSPVLDFLNHPEEYPVFSATFPVGNSFVDSIGVAGKRTE